MIASTILITPHSKYEVNCQTSQLSGTLEETKQEEEKKLQVEVKVRKREKEGVTDEVQRTIPIGGGS